jgi:hypothetical protein
VTLRSERKTPPDLTTSRRTALQHVLRASGLALLGGLVLGGLTSYGQTVLPDALSSFANSAGGWTMLAFLLVWLGRARPVLAAVLGVVAFEALVEGYGLVSGWRGFFYQQPFSGVFNLVGLVAGPVLGVAASLTRHATGPWRALAVAPLSAVLLGEGLYGLVVVGETTSPVYWVLQLVLGTGFLALACVRASTGRRWVLLTVLLTLAGAAVFLTGYRALSG